MFMEIYFFTYDILNSFINKCIFLLGSYAKICMNFGIFMNNILMIEINNLKFYFMNILVDVLKKICKKSHKSTLYTFELLHNFYANI